MIVYTMNGDEIFKYEVVFDKEKLNKLKYVIIEKCSYIEHKDYESTISPKMYGELGCLKYRNYKEERVGIREYNDFYSSSESLYRFTYDKYNFPYLVELIDKLLNGDASAIDDIYYKKSDIELIPIDKRIKDLCNLIDNTNENDVNKKVELLKELSELYKQKELNKNQESIDKYYREVRKLISFKTIDILKKSELERVLDFYNRNLDNNIYLDKMILKYIKK